ncbi:hypothetical protein EVAR_39452_1 [Eumeta japonica]|uniref:Uncharacterized protein n=1 Tax=Eumeta variegata TaxID=151549 RepID=A0A4C1W2M2_EUMVA|nr:hypothetical protein EVAR_39452_1 [Eumeta japonica]
MHPGASMQAVDHAPAPRHRVISAQVTNVRCQFFVWLMREVLDIAFEPGGSGFNPEPRVLVFNLSHFKPLVPCPEQHVKPSAPAVSSAPPALG